VTVKRTAELLSATWVFKESAVLELAKTAGPELMVPVVKT
jgi:hypothetical protein